VEWADQGLVLSARRHGENATVVNLLTYEHGRHAGLVRGGQGTKARGLYQPGNHVAARWRGRLLEHLGNWTCEMVTGFAATIMDEPGKLSALSSACAMLEAALPEREPVAKVYADSYAFISGLSEEKTDDTKPGWPEAYARWELQFLADLGFGLDLSACAATGVTDNLVFVSPKSGRSVSAEAGEPYRDKLLDLPAFLHGDEVADMAGVRVALRLTGYFLERHVFEPQGRTMPPARTRLVEALA
jgi:DNA repair protein RecO (recombination protein O)